jgi:hypothetical protein
MSSWARIAGVLVLGGGLAAGCAKGGENSETDDDPAGSGGTGGAAGGMGGMGGFAGMGGEGGTPEMCSEDPCKLVLPQCGCGEGTQCTVDQGGARSCVPEGDSAPATYCSNDCTPGHLCVNNGGTGLSGICHKFCATDADCAPPGGLCVLPLTSGAATVCSQNCDPISDTGCKEAEPGLKCDLGREAMGAQRWFTRCLNAGAGVQNSVCTSPNQCAPGHGCLGVDMEPNNYCLEWCNTLAPQCPAAHSCASFLTPITIGAITYGACLPDAGFP